MNGIFEKEKVFKKLAKYFLQDMQNCPEQDHKQFLKHFLEQMPILFDYGQHHFMYFFKYFVRYLVTI